MSIDLSSVTWRKSSRSKHETSCVEVAELDGRHHAVRNSKDPAGPAPAVPRMQGATFPSVSALASSTEPHDRTPGRLPAAGVVVPWCEPIVKPV